MKLFHIETHRLVELLGSDLPPYAILSHTWTCQDAMMWTASAADLKLHRQVPLCEKVIRAGQDAVHRGIAYLWVDSLCIDSSSSAALDEAVNGSFRRLSKSSICLAYLDDLPASGPPFDQDIWRRCKYWTRAWTLQELIVPPRVDFYDQRWNRRCSKASPEFLPLLSNVTGIPTSLLLDNSTLSDFSLAVRMSWSAGRYTNREEDTAYSLLALFGVTMQVRYGEGAETAFLRLQEEILHATRDGSIFAWQSDCSQKVRGLLARSPSEFRHFSKERDTAWQRPWIFDGKVQFSSKGIRVQSRLHKHGSSVLIDIGRPGQDVHAGGNVGVYLKEWNSVYVRVNPASTVKFSGTGRWMEIDVDRDVDSRSSSRIDALLNAPRGYIDITRQEYRHDSDSPGNKESRALEQCLSQRDTELAGEVREVPLRPAQVVDSSPPHLSRRRSSHTPPIVESFGTKRSRSGRLIMSITNSHRPGFFSGLCQTEDVKILSSSSELDSSASDNGSDSEEDLESEDQDSLYHGKSIEESPLHLDDEFQNLRPGLLRFSRDNIRPWVVSARYVAPPDDRLPPRKRAKAVDCQHRSTYIENIDQDDPGLVIVSNLDGYFHLACPFYVFNPEKYQRCLLQDDLRSIEDVIRHLWQDHSTPPYCPMCYRAFDKTVDRDRHVRERTCEFRNSGEFDGINGRQKAELAKRNRLYLGEATQWLRVWHIIFPESGPRRSPYLDDGVGRAVSIVRDRWATHGRELVSQYLTSHGLVSQYTLDNEKVFATLCRLTLEDLLAMVVEDPGLLQEGSGNSQARRV